MELLKHFRMIIVRRTIENSIDKMKLFEYLDLFMMKGYVSLQFFFYSKGYVPICTFILKNSISYLEKGRSKSFDASKEINMSIMNVRHFYEKLER